MYSPQSLNRYSYVWNNPLRYTDPSGRVVTCSASGCYSSYTVLNNPQPKKTTSPIISSLPNYAAVQGSSTKQTSVNNNNNPKTQSKPSQPQSSNNQPLLNSNADLSKINILTIQNNQREIAQHPFLSLQGISNMRWFYNKVKSYGDWDYKRKFGEDYEPFGNVNFGMSAREAGIPKLVAEIGAGFIQVKEHGPFDRTVHLLPPYWGDDVTDHNNIENGYEKIGKWY